MGKQFTLGKNERLKSRKLIEQLFAEGKSFVVFPFRVYYGVKLESAIGNRQSAEANREPGIKKPQASNLQPPTSNLQPPTSNPQPPTSNLQPPTSNLQPPTSNLLFGVGVSGKHFKKAVDRNRIKRLTREAYRLQKIALQEKLKEKSYQLHLFFIYTGKELVDFNMIREKTGVILNKLWKLADENNFAGT